MGPAVFKTATDAGPHDFPVRPEISCPVPDTADLTFPVALAEVFAIGFEWDWDEDTDESTGCDFEPYEQFEAPDRTAWWFRLWTGNDEVDGGEFRFFGSTGAGDYAGCWLIRPDAPLTDQPIIYVGSEQASLGLYIWYPRLCDFP